MRKYFVDESNSRLSEDVGITPIEEEKPYRKCSIRAHQIALLEKKYLYGKNVNIIASFLRSKLLENDRRDFI